MSISLSVVFAVTTLPFRIMAAAAQQNPFAALDEPDEEDQSDDGRRDREVPRVTCEDDGDGLSLLVCGDLIDEHPFDAEVDARCRNILTCYVFAARWMTDVEQKVFTGLMASGSKVFYEAARIMLLEIKRRWERDVEVFVDLGTNPLTLKIHDLTDERVQLLRYWILEGRYAGSCLLSVARLLLFERGKAVSHTGVVPHVVALQRSNTLTLGRDKLVVKPPRLCDPAYVAAFRLKVPEHQTLGEEHIRIIQRVMAMLNADIWRHPHHHTFWLLAAGMRVRLSEAFGPPDERDRDTWASHAGRALSSFFTQAGIRQTAGGIEAAPNKTVICIFAWDASLRRQLKRAFVECLRSLNGSIRMSLAPLYATVPAYSVVKPPSPPPSRPLPKRVEPLSFEEAHVYPLERIERILSRMVPLKHTLEVRLLHLPYLIVKCHPEDYADAKPLEEMSKSLRVIREYGFVVRVYREPPWGVIRVTPVESSV